MKTTTSFFLASCFTLCFTTPVQAAIPTGEDSLQRLAKSSYDEGEPVENSNSTKLKSSSSFAARNNSVVSIRPDIIKRAMHVTVKKINAVSIKMDVFDGKGNTVKRYELTPKEHLKINGLNPGKYTYLILIENKETLKGLFEIK